MKKLIVKHKGKILKELSLQKEEQYSIGRGKNNQIVLPEQAGISRKHLSLFIGEEGQWTVKNLSSAENLVIDGETTEESPVHNGFQVQDFEFTLCEEDKSQASLKSQQTKALSEKVPALSDPQSVALYKRTESQLTRPTGTEQSLNTLSDSSALPSADIPQDESLLSTDDKTRIMDMDSQQASMSAFLKVSYEDDNARDIFKLENQSEWTFGRDETADIMVDNPNISRKHFKISQEGQNYYIEDLKSSNGTLLNDKELKPGKLYAIQSGDIIYILDMEIAFEIRNLALEKELVRMKAPPPAPVMPQGNLLPSSLVAGGWPQAPLPANTPGVVVEMPESSAGLAFIKKNKKRFIIYGSLGVIALTGLLFLNVDKQADPAKTKTVTAVEGDLAGLSEHEIKMVKRSYQTALHLYTTGKFVYCQSEIKQIHKYTNSYQDSKKLEIACAQAAENANRQHAMEEKRKKAETTDKFIQQVTDKCREKFDTFKFKHELVTCLNPAIELSPADGRVQALTDQFDTNETLKEEKRKQIAERKKFIQSLAGKYNYAKSLHKKGRTLKAISAYQHFINISGHKELAQKRALAQRELASIKKEFQDNNSRMESTCKSYFSAKEFKKAYSACDIAGQKIPAPHNKNVLLFKEKAKNSLALIMKPLYEEANLNESVGNVSAAQGHWKKILNQDVPTGVYYKRAKDKLNKY